MPEPLRILIPTHGRSSLLSRTIDSIAACRIPEGYSETIIVENGPRSGAETTVSAAADAHPHLSLRYMHVERANKSNALNEALKTVADGLVVFFDDDVRVTPDTLDAYAKLASTNRKGAFFGGPVDVEFEEQPPEWLLQLLPLSVRGFTQDKLREVDYFLGANWAAFVEDLRTVGGFDPEYGPGSPSGARGQESEMQKRLKNIGLRMIPVDDAVVIHAVPRERCSSEWAVQRQLMSGISLGRRARQGYGPRLLKRSLVEIPASSIRYTLGKMRSSEESTVRANADLRFYFGYLTGFLKLR